MTEHELKRAAHNLARSADFALLTQYYAKGKLEEVTSTPLDDPKGLVLVLAAYHAIIEFGVVVEELSIAYDRDKDG